MRGDGDVAGQRTGNSAPKALVIGLSAFAIAGWLFVACINFGIIRAPKLVLGILALTYIFTTVLALGLLMWKVWRRELPSYWYLNYLGFWLMVAACAIVVCTLVLQVLFELLIPLPSFLPAAFVGDLSWVGLVAVLLAFVAFAIWLLQIALRMRRNIRRWLDSTES